MLIISTLTETYAFLLSFRSLLFFFSLLLSLPLFLSHTHTHFISLFLFRSFIVSSLQWGARKPKVLREKEREREEHIIILIIQYYNEWSHDSLFNIYSFTLANVLVTRAVFLFPSLPPFTTVSLALILCTWWSKSGNSSTRAFCQTDYGTSTVSLAPSHPLCGQSRFAFSLSPGVCFN